jgi:signal transduction histidine kinase
LRPIIESLADGVVVVDGGGNIRFANPAAGHLFNRPADELIGTAFGTPVVAGETTEMEIVRRGGGEVVYAELRVVDTTWDGDQAELVSLREITDRKRSEERARQLAHEREARVEAEAASQAKSDFLAIMSHELRTPLNAILGYSELMELGISGDLNDAVRKQVGRIRVSAKHLLGLVNDILDLAKVEAGRLSVAAISASISESIVAAVTLIHPQAAAKNLELTTVSGSETLPNYIGDDERVRQILVNLLSNAVKCTQPGGKITVEASVADPAGHAELRARKSYICVRVTDTGIGIEPDKLDAIFEPFVQGDAGPTRTQEGSGLGLTIGRRLARAMGGDLTVESEVGKGSTFALWLPADDSETSSMPTVTSEGEMPGSHGIIGTTPERSVSGLGEIADSVLARIAGIQHNVVECLRCDNAIPMAKGLTSSQLSDHLATLIADMVGALAFVEEASGKPSQLLADAMEIQRLVSTRHGAQRAQLGWNESAMRREFMIIREELSRAIRESAALTPGLSADDVMSSLSRFLDQAEYVAVRSLEAASQ